MTEIYRDNIAIGTTLSKLYIGENQVKYNSWDIILIWAIYSFFMYNFPESNPSSHIKTWPMSTPESWHLANEKLGLWWQSSPLGVVRIVLAGCWHYNKESLVQGGAVTVTASSPRRTSPFLHCETEVKLDKNDNSDNYSENPDCWSRVGRPNYQETVSWFHSNIHKEIILMIL